MVRVCQGKATTAFVMKPSGGEDKNRDLFVVEELFHITRGNLQAGRDGLVRVRFNDPSVAHTEDDLLPAVKKGAECAVNVLRKHMPSLNVVARVDFALADDYMGCLLNEVQGLSESTFFMQMSAYPLKNSLARALEAWVLATVKGNTKYTA
ncbi:uncharacterized protein SPPG_04444 [Spizellomyces punctatus DAOM BR117]|uniref:Uncharacterized protein n=1 Tax=Spizellomyces punctatus (strain DAOM BR117) TaxID=645134 RepID=A0A0L0HGG5_SPIPD|nr:uncharacterized protein SPPG_04444 [Spizellomyces punctatus DAOM BR117]KND00102.1 hypothetical protein SPPG_04444 [Spizellomyces punctatus DAOM BR117]|eukprot:XP_016608141.1 hypothetical protein SPPG_04444 [Spizellomyces punctatus DAOM BR117]